jgi:UDP-N-acetylmuramyl pentapeptide synthase
MKRALKNVVVAILAWQTRRLYRKNQFKTIAIGGSYGKTSTKLAIAQVLQGKYRVQYQDGNYNDVTTVPLVLFGRDAPPLFNPIAWLAVFAKNELSLRREYGFGIVVVELGIDGPGQMREFTKYLRVDHALVTAIAPEHMEFFGDIDDVASEELSLADFSREVLVNGNLCPDKLPKELESKITRFKVVFDEDDLAKDWQVKSPGMNNLSFSLKASNIAQLHTYANAAVVAAKMGMTSGDIKNALAKIKTVPGRMNTLEGKAGSAIIDDTYNASPDAVSLALYELGAGSEKYHRSAGKKCDPKRLDLVVTLGPEANEFLAAEAEKQGCNVERTSTPYEAATKIEKYLGEGVVVLAKGSQNGVFAEEAVKLLLANPGDAGLLVRQSPQWLKKKQKSFGR